MWIKNRWLRALLMLPLALLPMHAKDIEEILRVMNEAKVEFTIPDEDGKGDANWPPMEIEPVQARIKRGQLHMPGSEKTPTGNSQE